MAKKTTKREYNDAQFRAEMDRLHQQWERDDRIKRENFTESPVLKNTFTCETCSALVHENNLIHHFNWHEDQNSKLKSMERDIAHIERNVELPAKYY